MDPPQPTLADGLTGEGPRLAAMLWHHIKGGDLQALRSSELLARVLAAGPLFSHQHASLLLLAITGQEPQKGKEAEGETLPLTSAISRLRLTLGASAPPPPIDESTRLEMVLFLATEMRFRFQVAEVKIEDPGKTLLDVLQGAFRQEWALLRVCQTIALEEPSLLDSTVDGMPVLAWAAKEMRWEFVAWYLSRFGSERAERVRLLNRHSHRGESFIFHYELHRSRQRVHPDYPLIHEEVVSLVTEIRDQIEDRHVVAADAYPPELLWFVGAITACTSAKDQPARPCELILRPCELLTWLQAIHNQERHLKRLAGKGGDIQLDDARLFFRECVENPHASSPRGPSSGHADYARKADELFQVDRALKS